LILEALKNNVQHLSNIAQFANVNPSTAHHHLKIMAQGGVVRKIGRGKYVLDVQTNNEAPASEDEEDSTFSKPFTFLKNFSNFDKTFTGSSGQTLTLNRHEKNILLEVLSKENEYTPFTATQLAKKCKLSVKMTIQYAERLQKKGLITMNKDGRCWVFVPNFVAIKGLTEFLGFSKKEEKDGKRYSKKEKVNGKSDEDKPVFETFEEALSWQLHNAHRLILQFRILRCDHEILRKTAWVFERKAIQKHLPEAYVYKAKDVNSFILNVCPKKQFIFNTQFEFQDQLSQFINDLRKRLKGYGVILDLSEPVKVCLEHRAIENDEFAKQSVRKGLLYLKIKTIVRDENGEPLEITTVIDKSRAIHLEWQGSQNVDVYATNYSDFVEDVATGRIDKEALKELPEQNRQISDNIYQMSSTMGNFSNVMEGYGQHIQNHIGAIVELGESTSTLSNTVSKQINKLTKTVTEQTSRLTDAVEKLTEIVREKEAEKEDIEEETVIYERGRAKIPVTIHKHSNLRYKKSNKKTKPFKFISRSGYWELIPVKKGRIRRTRIIYLPKRAEKGTKLKWWLEDGTICLKIMKGVPE